MAGLKCFLLELNDVTVQGSFKNPLQLRVLDFGKGIEGHVDKNLQGSHKVLNFAFRNFLMTP